MTDVELKLNAWTDNPGTSVFAVQGEQESRTLHVTLIDRTGINSDVMSVAKVTPRYIDLTGYTARLYVVKSDKTMVFFPGTLVDAENGKVDFTLTGQCVAAPGKAECTIVLTKEDIELKIVGIVLDVRENDLEGSIESSDEWVELDVMLTKAQEAIDACEAATDAANSAASLAETKITEMDQLEDDLETAEAARVTAEQGRESAEVARQDAEQQRQTDTASAISAANTAAASANTAADRANKAAEAIEGTDVGDLAVRVDTLEGEMDTVNSKIDGLNVPEMQQSITQLESEMDTAQGDITDLESGLSKAQQDINTLRSSISFEPLEANVPGTCYLLHIDGYNKVVMDITANPENGVLTTLPVPPAMQFLLAGPILPTSAISTTNRYILTVETDGKVTGAFAGGEGISETLPLHIEFSYIS